VRITFVLPTVSLSGGIRVCAIHARAMAERGHRVVLVSPPPAVAYRERIRHFLRTLSWQEVPARLPSHLDGLGLDHRVLDKWRPVTDADVPDADVVVATWWETAEWVNALAPAKGAKAYFIQHHEVFPNLPVARVRATYHLPLHKIVIARWLQEVMTREYGDDQADLVPNAVDHGQFFAPPRGKQPCPTVGFLHHWAHFKGVDVALAALARLHYRHADLRVVSFGEAPIGMLDLGCWIEFAHSPPQDRLRHLYARCDAWITASRSEGFNLPAMEAMACRTPLVATRTGWPAEAIETRKNGILVDIDDAEGLAEGIEWILGLSDARWRELSRAAYDTVAHCSWERSADLFEAALLHACRRAARGEIGGANRE
jgi:glycosyltransferase involved in cell wall biosynthesis